MAADILSEILETHEVRRGSMVNDRQVTKESELTLETLRKLNRIHILLNSSRTYQFQYPVCLAKVRYERAFG
jgi:hypothetical protein